MYIFRHNLFPGWPDENDIAKPQVSINSDNSSTDCKKTATGNGNLKPEIKSNEYSSSKKNYSSTRGSPMREEESMFFYRRNAADECVVSAQRIVNTVENGFGVNLGWVERE